MNNVEGTVGGVCKPVACFTKWERKYFDSYFAFIILYHLSGYCREMLGIAIYTAVRKPIYRTVNLARLFQMSFSKICLCADDFNIPPYYALYIQSTRNTKTA